MGSMLYKAFSLVYHGSRPNNREHLYWFILTRLTRNYIYVFPLLGLLRNHSTRTDTYSLAHTHTLTSAAINSGKIFKCQICIKTCIHLCCKTFYFPTNKTIHFKLTFRDTFLLVIYNIYIFCIIFGKNIIYIRRFTQGKNYIIFWRKLYT
jgi:hypothetical protein